MKRVLVAWAVVWALGASEAWSQGIAVIDLRYVFDNHTRYKQMMEQLRTRVQAAQEQIKKRRAHIQQLIRERNRFKPQSASYKQLDAEIAKLTAELEAQFRLQQKEFALEEAKIRLTIYNEIVAEVRNYAQQRNLWLVIRFDGGQINEVTPPEVYRYVNRLVVHHHPALDITRPIVQALNARVAQNPRPLRPGVPLPPQRR